MAQGFGGGVFGGGFGGGQNKPREGVHFHLMDSAEQQEAMQGLKPLYRNFECGHCGRSTNGRTLCTLTDEEQNELVAWCHCSCEKQLPTVVVSPKDGIPTQYPEYCEFQPGANWPTDLTTLFEEATKSFSASAYTSTTMVCRKILMVCACHEGAAEGLSFVKYVDYIVDNVLPLPKARDSIDAIRKIGNDANHGVAFVSRDDARRALSIVTYLLNSVYSLPES